MNKVFMIPLLACALLMTACRAKRGENADSSLQDAFTPLEGRNLGAARVSGGPAALRNLLYKPTVTCLAPLGTALSIGLFKDGFFKVSKPHIAACGALSGDAAWVGGRALAIDARAYAGLTEVTPNSALSVKMNYAGDAIFCTAGRCLVSASLYGQNRCFLRGPAAKALQSAAIVLQRKRPTWKLRALDCYRPAYVQERMWELVPDPQWVAKLDRSRGNYSNHNRGLAIDLTLEDTASGVFDADMGSGFDEFTARSRYDAGSLSAAQKANRALLREVMMDAGFAPYDGEWWHFSWRGADAALDLPL